MTQGQGDSGCEGPLRPEPHRLSRSRSRAFRTERADRAHSPQSDARDPDDSRGARRVDDGAGGGSSDVAATASRRRAAHRGAGRERGRSGGSHRSLKYLCSYSTDLAFPRANASARSRSESRRDVRPISTFKRSTERSAVALPDLSGPPSATYIAAETVLGVGTGSGGQDGGRRRAQGLREWACGSGPRVSRAGRSDLCNFGPGVLSVHSAAWISFDSSRRARKARKF